MKTQSKPSRYIWVMLFFCAYLPAFSGAKLDYARVKSLYKDGEFEVIREELERFLKNANSNASREDLITAYKYLGVVYGSKLGGKPQSETYFFRLLDLAPMVNLTELYVSSSVDQIFRDTRERFISEKQSSSAVDEYGNPKTAEDTKIDPMAKAANKGKQADSLARLATKTPTKNTSQTQPRISEKKVKVWPWVLGAAVVGGGVGLYLMTSQSPPAESDTLVARF
jgi:hypothetical protein